MNLHALKTRAALYHGVRQFFAERGVLEVETPILSRAGNTDPNIDSFVTTFTGHRDAGPAARWLRTSPEFPLKRLLAAGAPDCYELGRVFRNGEAGSRHNPEFTMLEWYRLGIDHRQLAEEVIDLVQLALGLVGRHARVERVSYRDWFWQSLNIDPMTAPIAVLQAALGDIQINADGLNRDDWLDLLITHRLSIQVDGDLLQLVYDYPASQCALARLRTDQSIDGTTTVAERFELMLGGVELANGYHELKDATEQAERFARDHATRASRQQPLPPVDQYLLAALPGLPDCAGVAMGMDRLLLAMLGETDIRNLLAFPFAQA
ncbi:EF-P lysine aminoacylase GenX [Ahniella affigens]|uniref:EF-P lysine aminoacylase GenX n=1 Tax=Ahniella affigens TaxID=2021234 RepID=A0A2P1PP28_9GAMM|nr:EF-P lysine aminoacylase EpmA [Ahniella affigens]AVP96601.1 EF-P lysine aminoacylase GenX [Ahniella affigens]